MPAQSVSKEEMRQPIPGTWCSMVVESDFRPARRFSGFEHSQSGSNIIVSMLSSSYVSNVNALTADKLKRQGMDLQQKRDVKLEKNKATYVMLLQTMKEVVYCKQMLLIGDSERTVTISGFCKIQDTLRLKSIEKMLLTVIYDPNDLSNLLDAVPFRIDPQQTGYRPVRYSAGRLYYTIDGFVPTRRSDKAMFIASSDSLKLKDDDRQKYALMLLKNLPGIDTIRNPVFEPILQDKIAGFTIKAEGRFPSGKPQIIYAVYLDDEKYQYYLMTGVVEAGSAIDQTQNFKKLASTFKRK